MSNYPTPLTRLIVRRSKCTIFRPENVQKRLQNGRKRSKTFENVPKRLKRELEEPRTRRGTLEKSVQLRDCKKRFRQQPLWQQ